VRRLSFWKQSFHSLNLSLFLSGCLDIQTKRCCNFVLLMRRQNTQTKRVTPLVRRYEQKTVTPLSRRRARAMLHVDWSIMTGS
jgi:hypothetical protein